jgi:hypothetical protein
VRAAAAGIKIFGVCTDGSDLLGNTTILSNHTIFMIEMVLSVVPDALLLPRIPIGAGPVWPRTMSMSPGGQLSPLPYGSMTAGWSAAAGARMGALLRMLDEAFPGKIAGVHLAGLAAGEMRFACPPEESGYADYSPAFQAEFCEWRNFRRRGGNGGGAGGTGGAGCAAPTAAERCTPQDGNLFAARESAEFNLFISEQVEHAIASSAAAVKQATGGRGLVVAFYGYLNELGGHRAPGSGHLALGALLADPNIDGIASPYKCVARGFAHARPSVCPSVCPFVCPFVCSA